MVVNVGRRPKFPEGTPKPIAAIVEQCWDSAPSKRPSFRTVKAKLDELIGNYEELLAVYWESLGVSAPSGSPAQIGDRQVHRLANSTMVRDDDADPTIASGKISENVFKDQDRTRLATADQHKLTRADCVWLRTARGKSTRGPQSGIPPRDSKVSAPVQETPPSSSNLRPTDLRPLFSTATSSVDKVESPDKAPSPERRNTRADVPAKSSEKSLHHAKRESLLANIRIREVAFIALGSVISFLVRGRS